MLKINEKTFLNIQEAVQWLMDNNALPFQCTANYAANTEIGLGTIVNPTMAKVRIGSLIFFADSKVSTVTGITDNGFIVSDKYNDLVDDVVYVSNVQINASGHLIVTLSNGTQIDAGLIKQVAAFSINGSQHLIATYNDGTTNDLGAIFSGNISISGNLSVSGTATFSGSINGEANPSVKPIYYHPIYVLDLNEKVMFTCLILNNSPTPFTWATFKAFIESVNYFSLQPVSGVYKSGTYDYQICRFYHTTGSNITASCLNLTTGNISHVEDFTAVWASLFTGDPSNTDFTDAVNKIN